MLPYSRPNYTPDAAEEAFDCIRRGQLDPGPVAEDFAHALAEFWGVPRSWVLLTASCTTALKLATDFLGQGELWEVPVFTWPATYSQLRHRRFYDVNDIPPQGNRIMAPLWGYDWSRAGWLQDGPGVGSVVMDSAHTLHPSTLEADLRHGSIDAACFSFGPIKEITTIHGGALVSVWASELESTIHNGTLGKRFYSQECGFNGTITEPGAALGLAQLGAYRRDYDRRMDILDAYNTAFARYGDTFELVTLPSRYRGHLAVLKYERQRYRDHAQAYLASRAVGSSIHYPLPIDVPRSGYKNAADLADRVLTIPCFSAMTDADVRRVVNAVTGALSGPYVAGLELPSSPPSGGPLSPDAPEASEPPLASPG